MPVVIDDRETAMRRVLVALYKAHPELSTMEKVQILMALGVGEHGIGEVLAGKSWLSDTGNVIGSAKD